MREPRGLHTEGAAARRARVKDMDLIELNEAFAARVLACMRELELDPERTTSMAGRSRWVTRWSEWRVLTTLVHALARTGGRYGLATMCIGVGQGIAMVVERV